MITMQICLTLAAVFFAAGSVQLRIQNKKRKNEMLVLEYAGKANALEAGRQEERKRLAAEERERQKSRRFCLDFLVMHGSAFGGFAATCPDGTSRRGSVRLNQVMLYGKNPMGEEFTYYIEEPGIEICAMDEPDVLLVKSADAEFEIREEGVGRDQGSRTRQAVIRAGRLYYIILESRHEIAIRATKKC